MDKDEIAGEAARLGTLPISNIPDQDCCTLFTPRHPATRADGARVKRAEDSLRIEEMVRSAVSASAVEEFVYPC
jgi:thiamine biosynthesis protein ThiI